MNKYVDKWNYSGTVLIAQKGKIVYQRPFGYRDFDKKLVFENDSKIRIASLGKIFTAILIMKLVDENKLDLQAPISKYLKKFNYTAFDTITIHQLLCHTSGLSDYMFDPSFKHSSEFNDLDRIMDIIIKQKLIAKPGTQYSYSNSGYVVLGKIIEEVTGKSFREYYDESLFLPTGMRDTKFITKDSNEAAQLARGNFVVSSSKYIPDDYEIIGESASPVGGEISTANDLLKFDQALYNIKFIPSALIDLSYVPKTVNPTNEVGYGYGWQIFNKSWSKNFYHKEIDSNKLIVGHSGGGKGISTFLIRVPSDSITIILLSNIYTNITGIGLNIYRTLISGKIDEPAKSIQVVLADIIIDHGIDYLNKNYDQLINNELKGIKSDNWITAAYNLSEIQMPFEGINLLKFAITKLPNDLRTIINLADLCNINKRYTEALQYYNVALDKMKSKSGFAYEHIQSSIADIKHIQKSQ
ncbi:MAG: hypothetical protein NVS3B19_16380 [Ginsengibacter sp.]